MQGTIRKWLLITSTTALLLAIFAVFVEPNIFNISALASAIVGLLGSFVSGDSSQKTVRQTSPTSITVGEGDYSTKESSSESLSGCIVFLLIAVVVGLGLIYVGTTRNDEYEVARGFMQIIGALIVLFSGAALWDIWILEEIVNGIIWVITLTALLYGIIWFFMYLLNIL